MNNSKVTNMTRLSRVYWVWKRTRTREADDRSKGSRRSLASACPVVFRWRSAVFPGTKMPSMRWRMCSLGPRVILRELVWSLCYIYFSPARQSHWQRPLARASPSSSFEFACNIQIDPNLLLLLLPRVYFDAKTSAHSTPLQRLWKISSRPSDTSSWVQLETIAAVWRNNEAKAILRIWRCAETLNDRVLGSNVEPRTIEI